MPRVTLQKDEHDLGKVKLYTMMKVTGAHSRDICFLDAVFHADTIEDIFGSRVVHEIEMRGQIDVDISATIVGNE